MTYFIPLGTRCSAGFVLQKMDLRVEAYPFDWADLSFKSIESFVGVSPTRAEAHYRDQFSRMNPQTRRTPNDALFPHDIAEERRETGAPDIQDGRLKPDVVDTYVRRGQRLADRIATGEKLVFLSVLDVPAKYSVDSYRELVRTIEGRASGDLFFISINLMGSDVLEGNHLNLAIPLDAPLASATAETFDRWENAIASSIRNHPATRDLFPVIPPLQGPA